MTRKSSILKRLILSLNERRGMNAYANVMSGRTPRWYARPLDWIAPLAMILLIVVSVAWEVFRYIGIPLLVVCMFVMLLRMNDKLTVIEAQLAPPAIRKVVTTIPISEYIKHIETEHPETE